MKNDVLADCLKLFDLMRGFWSTFGHQMNKVLLRGRINLPQYMALVALKELGHATMGQVSKKLHVTMGASTNIIDKLVRAGYVSRERSTEDRRVVKVKLEAKGEEMLREIDDKATDFMAGILSQLGDSERKQLIASYERMAMTSDSEGATEPAAACA
jgi:DNA-binding MarR family transcriptional regulator